MSYSVSGKIAGFGDAASDAAMAAYQTQLAAWQQQKAAYDQAYAAFAAASAGQQASYSQAQSAYQRDLTAWQQESSARALAVTQQQQIVRANKVAQDLANKAAQAAGVVLPPGYGGCVTAAQHAAWASVCNAVSTTVKGLGQDPTGPSCALALLPMCVTAPPLPAPLRPQPVPPKPPAALTPPTPPPPAPTPPASTVTTPGGALVPTTPSTVTAPTPTKSGGALRNGLILIALGGAGYAIYRTLKKPRAAA